MDSHLAIIKSAEENNFVSGLNYPKKKKHGRYWIGLSTIQADKTMKWVDGSLARKWYPDSGSSAGFGYSNWYMDWEKESFSGVPFGLYSAALNPSGKRWFAVGQDYEDSYGFICEMAKN